MTRFLLILPLIFVLKTGLCQVDSLNSLKKLREKELLSEAFGVSEFDYFFLIEKTEDCSRYVLPQKHGQAILYLFNSGRFEYESITIHLNYFSEGNWRFTSDSTIHLESDKNMRPDGSFFMKEGIPFLKDSISHSFTIVKNALRVKMYR
ncbi:MAG: hypothetical protein KDE26_24315 [Bacteroidetes bacterium]|nr:hypothetical protein [Bacteroidota bacterium]